ncbi:hypothetical protein ILP92_10085 [Maribius pontilimi]|uniref:Uncharacterized protein n=1 Tax=Palleronia pontilimi TaxID=1964209 RepID=A0A934IHM6_9RHOB|nr:hypothetical protein [Palleronia pontilimi]MBJ3763093.1 hypothetical protein [Palleronia pontilimi]
MPCMYQIHPRENLIVKKYRGAITVREVLEFFDAIESDPHFRDGIYELDCLKDLTELKITVRDQLKLLDMIRLISTRKSGPSRKAMVAPSGIGRATANRIVEEVMRVRGASIAAFNDLPAALDFLGRRDLEKSGMFDWLIATVH